MLFQCVAVSMAFRLFRFLRFFVWVLFGTEKRLLKLAGFRCF